MRENTQVKDEMNSKLYLLQVFMTQNNFIFSYGQSIIVKKLLLSLSLKKNVIENASLICKLAWIRCDTVMA